QAHALDRANVIVRNIHDGITLWNEGARQLYGWSKEEAVGKVSHELLRTQFPVPYEDIERMLFSSGSWEGELVHFAKDGRKVISQSHWELHRDAAGTPVAIVETNADITDRKRSEEHIQFVMRELSHRSKNLLAVVQAIAHQTARHS